MFVSVAVMENIDPGAGSVGIVEKSTSPTFIVPLERKGMLLVTWFRMLVLS